MLTTHIAPRSVSDDEVPSEAQIAVMLIAISEILVSSVGLERAKTELDRIVEGIRGRMWMSSVEGSIH
ncbi:hypothetical protein [Aureimonas frigidaquae]|uniref:hypothetical protein n=1 Tax=Aureimonas frigidaquae TaxID=424757 RepID=UPI0007855337|nr:hypothetical protein [Aureimonas frigidaquae]